MQLVLFLLQLLRQTQVIIILTLILVLFHWKCITYVCPHTITRLCLHIRSDLWLTVPFLQKLMYVTYQCPPKHRRAASLWNTK